MSGLMYNKKKLLFIAAFGILFGAILLFAGCTKSAAPEVKPEEKAQIPPWAEKANGVTLEVSRPSNSTHFVAGQKPVITVTLKDAEGKQLKKEDFSALGLYMYGPQETTKTVSAVKLLNASTDRSKTPHHYIDLLNNEDVQISGNTLKYNLQAVTDEEPGTYTVALRVAVLGEPLSQYFELVDTQIGTATVEKQIVEKEKCADCHQGSDSKVFYLHHVDPGRSPTGSPSIDSWPVRTCKACHNNNGYAAYTLPTDRSVRVPDPIVYRVHGVHYGKHLESPISIGTESGDVVGTFADYLDVHFPADPKNCTKCHVDDRWKTQPNRLACGACHDNTWFGDSASIPSTAKAHAGGPQANDSQCSSCHPADTGGVKAVAEAHKIAPPAFKQTVELKMSAPGNGKFYVAGEKPQVTITIKDAATGAIIDPNTIVEPKVAANVTSSEWRRANLYVSGPRKGTSPVLTTSALLDPKSKAYTYANNDFRVRIDPKKEDPRISRSSTAITYQLDDVKGLKAGTYTAFVETIPFAPLGGIVVLNFQVGTDKEEAKVATNCVSCHEDTRMHAGYFAVPFNPDFCKSCHDYERQLAGKISWNDRNAGYGAAPLSRRVHGVHRGHYLDKPEEVHGVADAELFGGIIFPQDIRNCSKCHGAETSGTWKTEPSRVACNSCHDNERALSHTKLMTNDPTPEDPWGGDETETCKVCHGAERDFSPDKMHKITDPYVPIYPREHEH